MRATVAGCLAGLAALALASAASAATITFDGSCDVTGIAKFDHPLTGQPAANGYDFNSASGTSCTGTVDGKQVTDAPAVVHVKGQGTLSCAVSSAQAGVGTLTMTQGTATTADDVTVGFGLDIVGALTEVPLRVTGSQGGFGAGEASFRDSAGPGTVSDCNGAGVPQLGFTATFRTVQPIQSEATTPPPSPSPSGGSSSSQPSGTSGSQQTSSSSTSSSAPQSADSSSSGQSQSSSTTSTPAANKKAEHKKKTQHKKKKSKKSKHKKKRKKKRH